MQKINAEISRWSALQPGKNTLNCQSSKYTSVHLLILIQVSKLLCVSIVVGIYFHAHAHLCMLKHVIHVCTDKTEQIKGKFWLLRLITNFGTWAKNVNFSIFAAVCCSFKACLTDEWNLFCHSRQYVLNVTRLSLDIFSCSYYFNHIYVKKHIGLHRHQQISTHQSLKNTVRPTNYLK